MAFVSDWSREERKAYAKGIEKGQRLASEGERDRIARAALMGMLSNPKMGLYDEETLARYAYTQADAMLAEKRKDDEIPF